MWEQTARLYNDQRKSTWMERDYDSLKRKFRNLYGKPKPTGNNDGRISSKNKAVLWAHELQHLIEKESGAQETHDGGDDGEDDPQLVEDVEKILDAHAQRPVTGSSVVQEEASAEFERDSIAEDVEDTADDLTQYAQSMPTDSQELPFRRQGVIITRSGPVEAAFGDLLHSDTDLEDKEDADDSQQGQGQPSQQEPATPAAGSDATSAGQFESRLSPCPTPSATDETRGPQSGSSVAQSAGIRRTSPNTASTPTPGNRGPRGMRAVSPVSLHSPLSAPTTVLDRDLSRAEADAREKARNPTMTTTSIRLGGGDLRVLRDNFEAVEGAFVTAKGKRAQADSSGGIPTYASTKRARAKKRMDKFDTDLSVLERQQVSGSNEMTKLLIFFRDEAELRDAAENKRRREERDEKEMSEKKEREHRENKRRADIALAEARLQQQREDEKLRREELERKEAAARSERDLERAEERRRHEERMELERAEIRQRHEQMMLLLSTLGGKSSAK